MYSIGTDIGGTFTDCVVVDDEGAVTTGKAPSTPPNFSRGFFDAIADAAAKLGMSLEDLFGQANILVHATTAATNAIVERKGARVGLLTTRGHGEAILIMRGGGRSKGLEVDDLLYIPGTYKPTPIVPRDLIYEITERIDCFGDVISPLNENEAREGIRSLLAAGAETIAIGFLWSFLNPRHEERVAELVEEIAPGTFISLSSAVAPQVGEYYRIVATVFNSYVGPLMADYVGEIEEGAKARGAARPPLFAQCIGGTVPADEVKRRPLFTMDSGPVSGLVASNFLGSEFGYANIITADMGGTTFDVAVIADNSPRRREGTTLNKYHMYLPMLDVESIGAGGGSIAWIDPSSKTMKVGPRSAGAEPGPMCYRLGGTEPTVTDADVVLGIVNPNRFLGGRRKLDADAARDGVAALGKQIGGLSPEETASGIVEIIDNMMADKIRRMTVYRGHDPRDFVVFAYGGAGPTHAGAFARALSVPAVIVPIGNMASVLSAMGTISGDVAHIFDRVTRLAAPFDMSAISKDFEALEEKAVAQLKTDGFTNDNVGLSRLVSMKYGAQVFDIEVPFNEALPNEQLVALFEETYEQRFGKGSGYAPAGIEIIRQRVQAVGLLARPVINRSRANGRTNGAGKSAPVETRAVWWREEGRPVDTPIYDEISPGSDPVQGPAVIELPDTTIAVRPGERLESDEFGNLIIRFN